MLTFKIQILYLCKKAFIYFQNVSEIIQKAATQPEQTIQAWITQFSSRQSVKQ